MGRPSLSEVNSVFSYPKTWVCFCITGISITLVSLSDFAPWNHWFENACLRQATVKNRELLLHFQGEKEKVKMQNEVQAGTIPHS